MVQVGEGRGVARAYHLCNTLESDQLYEREFMILNCRLPCQCERKLCSTETEDLGKLLKQQPIHHCLMEMR